MPEPVYFSDIVYYGNHLIDADGAEWRVSRWYPAVDRYVIARVGFCSETREVTAEWLAAQRKAGGWRRV